MSKADMPVVNVTQPNETKLHATLREMEQEIARLLRENERLRLELEVARRPVTFGYPDPRRPTLGSGRLTGDSWSDLGIQVFS